jgi:hypothetical protein
LQIDLVFEDLALKDSFEFPLYDDPLATPEQFAERLCLETGLDTRFP